MITDTQIERWLTTRKMSHQQQTAWRRKYCRRQASYLWGERRIVTPVLVPVVYGDGLQVLAMRPIITRRSHYVIAIDSNIRVHAGDVHEITDSIYETLDELFGNCGCSECGGDPIPNDTGGWKENALIFKQWPTPCLNGGTEWWPVRGYS